MLSLTHAVTGAALGGQLGSPAVAFLGGVILHFFVDKIPHFWPKSRKYQNIIKLVDSALVILFVFGLYLWGGESKSLMIAGALGGAMVDAVIVLTPLEFKKIGLWHTRRQYHKENLWFYLPDILLVVTGLYLIWIAL